MPVDVTTETLIVRPRAEVAAFAGDPSNAPRWYANIRSVEWISEPGRVEPGAQIRFVAHFLGRKLTYTYEIMEHEPGGRLVMRTAGGPFPMETTYTWEDARSDRGAGTASATRMTLTNRGEPAGFANVVAPVMEIAVRRANKKDLEMLKQVLETE